MGSGLQYALPLSYFVCLGSYDRSRHRVEKERKMTDEEKVKAKYPIARCISVPDPVSFGRKIARYTIFLGLNEYPPRVGSGRTADLAWADAARKLDGAQ